MVRRLRRIKRPTFTKKKIAIMLWLIFPKSFERNLFLLELSDLRILEFVSEVENMGKVCETLAVYIRTKQGGAWMLMTVIGASDIEFNSGFASFIFEASKARFLTWHYHFVLCGTCGGSMSLGHNLGDTFFVSKAHKWDRGSVDIELKISIKGALSAEHSPPSIFVPNITQAVALSGNFLLNCDPAVLAKKLGVHGSVVGEMETYDFFAVARLLAFKDFSCLRIVSDVFGKLDGLNNHILNQLKRYNLNPPQGFESDDRLLDPHRHKLGRKLTSMTKLCDAVLVLAGLDFANKKSVDVEISERLYPRWLPPFYDRLNDRRAPERVLDNDSLNRLLKQSLNDHADQFHLLSTMMNACNLCVKSAFLHAENGGITIFDAGCETIMFALRSSIQHVLTGLCDEFLIEFQKLESHSFENDDFPDPKRTKITE